MCGSWRIVIVLAALNVGLVAAENVTYTSVVRTASGPVRGEILETVRKSVKYGSFRGIPYAEPPLKRLRFRPPVPKAEWAEVLNATAEGNVCPQLDQITIQLMGDEDCLYLNVYTPLTSFENLNKSDAKAVMVWIHGGAFTSGYKNRDLYGPDYLIENDVVVVAINYRLGILGFLNLNHPNATGNQGLKDQNLALRWTKKNIDLFGGDPDRITIFGQSAGAASIDYHILSGMSRGLFRNSIAMSGSVLSYYWGFSTGREAEFNAYTLAASLGIIIRSKDRILEKLYEASAKDIMVQELGNLWLAFRPSIERVVPFGNERRFLKSCPLKLLKTGNYNRSPHMMGYTSLELSFYLKSGVFVALRNVLQRTLNVTFSPTDPFFKRLQTQPAGRLIKKIAPTIRNILDVSSDLLFAAGIDTKQRLMEKNNKYPIYYYYSNYSGGILKTTNEIFGFDGVGHAEDLLYIFSVPVLNVSFADLGVNKIIDTYTGLWTNFAKYNDPTPSSETLGMLWPPSGAKGRLLEINLPARLRPRRVTKLVARAESLELEKLPLLSDCGFNEDLH